MINSEYRELTFFFLIVVAIGVVFLLVATIRIAGAAGKDSVATTDAQINKIQDLFSYFLQEEEKKNQDLRSMVGINDNVADNSNVIPPTKFNVTVTDDMYSDNDIMETVTDSKNIQVEVPNSETLNEVITLYKEGKNAEDIARQLGKGIGEINLILSLYSMN